MANTPTDVAQLAIDAIAIDHEIGDLEAGGRINNVTLRAYGECFRQLMRAAPWTFARREVPLLLLADASGNTAGVGSAVPGNGQYVYEYAYPTDCARIRYIPGYPLQAPPVPNGNITPPNSSSPTLVGLSTAPLGAGMRPTRFLLTNDPNYNTPAPNSGVQGQSPVGNTVILSNVPNATCVYTFNALYPSLWDHLFLAAMAAYLASEIALPLWSKDPKMGMALRTQQIAIAKSKLLEARAMDGNETWSSSDIRVDWMDFRRTGGSWSGWGQSGGDWGCWGNGWSGSLAFGDGTSF